MSEMSVEKPFEMNAHRLTGARSVAALDCRGDRLVLADGARHPSLLRQCQPPVAIDMNLDLLDQRPNPAMAGDLGDGAVKRLVRLMEGFAIAGAHRFALALQDGRAGRGSGCGRALRGEPRRRLFQRLANDDRLRQRGQRYARDEDARLRKYLEQPFVGEFQDRLAHRRAAEAVGHRDFGLGDRLARQPFERYQLGAQIRVDFGADPAGARRPPGFRVEGALSSGTCSDLPRSDARLFPRSLEINLYSASSLCFLMRV